MPRNPGKVVTIASRVCFLLIPVVKQTSCTLPSRFNKSQLCPRGVDLTFSLSHTNSRLISRPEGKESLLEEEELSLLAILMLVEYVTYYRGWGAIFIRLASLLGLFVVN